MARLPRLYAPQIPQLVQAEFAHPLAQVNEPTPVAQLDRLLDWLAQALHSSDVALHGWLLLNDRLTLLATPQDARSLSRVMQGFGRRMAAALRYGRVYAGRYRSTLIQPGHWVLPAMVWLESLPVQLHYVDQADAWPWSSAAGHAGVHTRYDALLTDHPDYWQIGNTPFARQAHYRRQLHRGLSDAQSRRIQQALFGQWVLGETAFLTALASKASRRIAPAPRGRPRKVPPSAA